jgi:hypothetical protein
VGTESVFVLGNPLYYDVVYLMTKFLFDVKFVCSEFIWC